MTSGLIKLYGSLCDWIPAFRKITRKWMYNAMSLVIRQDQWVFMNYGYSPLNGSEIKTVLDKSDEANRLCYQLYDHLAAEIDLADKSVLEVGSGRGGGATLIKKYHRPHRMVGVDYSSSAIRLCNRNLKKDGLSFIKGDAENLPFNGESFDAVINIESSHCYGSMKKFLSEVKKVLKPGGHFLFTDFRLHESLEDLDRQLHESGLKLLKRRDITQNILSALDEDSDRRMLAISYGVPKPFIKQFREFAGVKDSVVYNRFKNRSLVYFSYLLQKI